MNLTTAQPSAGHELVDSGAPVGAGPRYQHCNWPDWPAGRYSRFATEAGLESI